MNTSSVTPEARQPQTAPPAETSPAGDWRLGFASLETEIVSPRELEVLAGAIPAGLEGTLYRIGPARHDVYGSRSRHWFDGDGMVHALQIEGGKTTYRNRFVATRGKAEEDAAGRRIYGGFATRLPGGAVARFRARKHRKNPANTNIVFHGGKLLALCEGGRPYRVDPTTLETIEEDFLGGALGADSLYSAHAKHDPSTGEMINFGMAYGAKAEARIYRTASDGTTTRLATVELPWMAMVHDFAITKTKVVLIVAPVMLPRVPLGLVLGQRSYGESLRYRPERGAAIAVVDRATGETRWSKTDAFMMFHTAHAWDDGNDVVVDVCAYEDGRILRALTDVMAGDEPSPARSGVERIRLGADGAVRRSRPTSVTLEFPRVTRAWGEEPKHLFGVTWADGAPFLNQPVRVDLQRGTVQRAPVRPSEFAGECVPAGRWLLTVILDAEARRSELRILEADDIEAPPVARIALPHVMPLGFHGNFVPAAAKA